MAAFHKLILKNIAVIGSVFRLETMLLFFSLTACYKPIPKPASGTGTGTGSTNSVITLENSDYKMVYKGTTNATVMGYLSVWQFNLGGSPCLAQLTSIARPAIGLRPISFKPFTTDSVNVTLVNQGNLYSVVSGKILVQDAGQGGRKFSFQNLVYAWRAVADSTITPGPRLDGGGISGFFVEL